MSYRKIGQTALRLSVSAFVFAAASAPAFAQDGSASASAPEADSGANDIVVTATRRAEPLQKVPVAVSVVGGDTLRSENRSSIQGIAAIVPSLNFRSVASAKDQALFIRGLGTVSTSPGVEPTVSTIIDGVVLSRQGQASMDLMDIDRLEVLRGPQGTLFGKNASVGAVNIVTRAPADELGGFLDAGYYSGGNEWRVRGGLSGPLSNQLAFSVTAAYSHYDGNVTNVFDGSRVNGFENVGARAKLQFTPTDNIKLVVIGDYSDATNTSPQGVVTQTFLRAFPTNTVSNFAFFTTALQPAEVGPESRQINSDYFTRAYDKNYGLSAQMDIGLGDYTLTSITAWRGWSNDQFQDQDRLSAIISQIPRRHDIGNLDFNQYSQELRLASPKGQTVDFQVGLFYFRGVDSERYERTSTPLVGTPTTGIANFGVTSTSFAGFGEANIHFTDSFRATLGARVTRDNLSYHFDRTSTSAVTVNGIQPAFSSLDSTSSTGFSGRAGLQYDFSRSVMGYFSYGRGYKGPAYNLAFSMLAQDRLALNPETSNAFELGLKSRLFDNKLTFNVAVFLDKFQDYQVNFFDTFNGSNITRLINAGKVSTRGVEIDASFTPFHGFTLSAGGAYTDAHIDEFTCPVGTNASCQINGMALPYAPRWKGNVRARYDIPLGDKLALRLSTDANAQSEVQYSINQTVDTIQPSYGIWNASIGLIAENRWEINLVVKNITNKSYATNLQTFSQGVVRWVPRDDTRYFGVNAHLSF